MRPGGALGAEASADEGVLEVDIFDGNAEGAGDGHAVADDVLGGVVDVEVVAIPRGEGGVRLHGVVVLEWGGVGDFDFFGGLGEGGSDISALGFGSAKARIAGFSEAAGEVQLGGLRSVGDFEEAGGVAGLV